MSYTVKLNWGSISIVSTVISQKIISSLGQGDGESAPFSCKENDAVGDLDMRSLRISEGSNAPPRVSLMPFEEASALCTSTPIGEAGTGAEKKGGEIIKEKIPLIRTFKTKNAE